MAHKFGNKNFHKKQKPAYDKNNPILEAFSKISEELDQKNDRHERIVKISRDITIESKRIIFLLLTIDSLKNNKEKVLEEAKQRLDKLAETNFKAIANELKGLDQYQFLRAFTFGLQEYIEAYSFYDYIKGNALSHWNDIQKNLIFKDEETEEEVKCMVPPLEHILGLGDLTGEVMRRSINALGSGDIEACDDARKFLQQILTGFLSIGHLQNRDFGQKLFTLKQSVLKVEMVCYNIKVRGGEAIKLGATQGIFSSVLDGDANAKEEDEGFF